MAVTVREVAKKRQYPFALFRCQAEPSNRVPKMIRCAAEVLPCGLGLRLCRTHKFLACHAFCVTSAKKSFLNFLIVLDTFFKFSKTMP